ncbi:MAG: hypothetical protein ABID09_04825 [Candidatus Omnitrophota bacterium]
MKDIYLVETEEHVEDVLDKQKGEHGILIALTPHAMHALDKRDVKYHLPEEFYTEEELWQVGLRSFDIVKKICLRLDAFAFSRSEELKKRNIKLYTNFNVSLCVVLDSILGRVFQLKSIFRSHKPGRVFCYRSGIFPFSWRGIGFDKREFIYSRILEDCNWQEEIHFLESFGYKAKDGPEPRPSVILSDASIRAKNYIKKHFSIIYEIKKNGISALLRRLSMVFKKKTTCVLLGGEYEWGECEDFFNASGINLKKLDIKYANDGIPVGDTEVEKEISRELSDILDLDGLNISDLILPRLLFIFKEGAKRCVEAFDTTKDYIARENPRALLFSSLGTPEWRSAGEAFAQQEIPAFCKSHGATGSFEMIKVLDNELLYADYYLANTDKAVKLYKGLGEAGLSNMTVVSTGSPKLERLKTRRGKVPANLKKWLKEKNIDGKKKVCVYVTTLYLGRTLYYYFRPAWSDRIFFKTQSAIIDFFKKRDDTLLVWKLHPLREWGRPPLVETDSENIFVVQDEAQCIDLLDIADFIVIDAPSTTCLQAVAGKIPVFIVTKHVLYFDEAKEMLTKRTVCCQEPEALMGKVEDFIVRGRYDADINDDAFWKAYGIGYGDFDAAEKTVSTVVKALR